MKIKNLSTHTALALGLIAASGCATPQIIHPGAVWPDNRGQHVQAHGGGVVKLGHTYY